MNPALTERLIEISKALEQVEYGQQAAYLTTAAESLGMSVQTLRKKLKFVSLTPSRKRRSDAGTSALALEEAQLISAAVLEGMRKNGKRILTISHAVEMLRANGKVFAEQTNTETGEVTKLSDSAIERALRAFCLHPDQLLQPAPVTRMKSLHPNHWWQIAPSMCVLYYLPRSGDDTGLRVSYADEFYKNKPANLVKVLNDRVWRYTGTDHYSGTVITRYYFGGETSQNICDFFIFMMQEKADIGKDPFRGVPLNVMLDPGSANTSHSFKTLCQSLGVHVQVNKPKNPRAKGQVENANNLVETYFESGLRFLEINNIDELNAYSEKWMRYFNATKVHGRHGMTRYQCWNKIQAEHLLLAPPAEHCRELAVSAPKQARVTSDLEIKFDGKLFSVKDIEGVFVGQKVMVAKNAYRPDCAQVATWDANGHEVWQVVEPIEFDEAGFRSDAVVMGEAYRAPTDTKAQTNAKELDKLAMQADTLEQAAAKRKGKALPFGGEIDPFKHQEDALVASNTLYMPSQGQQIDYNKLEVTEQVLTKVEVAKLLKPRIEAAGGDWKQAVKTLQQIYPDGVLASEVETAFERLKVSGGLKLVKTGTHK